MTQAQWILLASKVGLIADVVSVFVFVTVYSILAPWWRNPVGQTIVLKDLLLAITFGLLAISVFTKFDLLQMEIFSWTEITLIILMAVVLFWRTWVFWSIHKLGQLINGTFRSASPTEDPDPTEEQD